MREEWKRQLVSPLFWGLLIGSVLINFWVLANFGGQRDLVKKSREVWEETQLSVSKESAGLYVKELEMAEEKAAGVPTIEQVMDGTLHLIQELNGEMLGSAFSSSLMLTGDAEEYVKDEYAKLDEVLEENRKDGTAAGFFVPGNRGFFELFSRWIPLSCTLEGILASILFMMKSVSEPFSVGTAAVVYTTKTGRKGQKTRRRAAALSGVAFSAGIWGLTILCACVVYPLGRLWQTRVGSMMILDSFLPVISRLPLTAASYVGVEFLISMLTTVLFSYISFVFVTKNKNSFRSFIQLGFICACIYTVTSLFPKDTRLFFTVQYNPVNLVQKAGHWLVSGGSFFSSQYYEVTVLLLWGCVIGVAVYLAGRRFAGEDL